MPSVDPDRHADSPARPPVTLVRGRRLRDRERRLPAPESTEPAQQVATKGREHG